MNTRAGADAREAGARVGEASGAGVEEHRPSWAQMIDPRAHDWCWLGERLFHRLALEQSYDRPTVSSARRLVLDGVYASHNESRAVRAALGRVLAGVTGDDWILNLGAGLTKVHSRAINLDIYDDTGIDVVARGQGLPFLPDSFGLVISQEVLEHLPDPRATVDEVYRVLRPGGVFYCQVPFIIGRHFGPDDYWRFTRQGIAELFDPRDWDIREISPSVGHGTGFYRIAVEFAAVTLSGVHSALYLPGKGAAALLLAPLKLADLLTSRVSEPDRIPGGYFCIAAKRSIESS